MLMVLSAVPDIILFPSELIATEVILFLDPDNSLYLAARSIF